MPLKGDVSSRYDIDPSAIIEQLPQIAEQFDQVKDAFLSGIDWLRDAAGIYTSVKDQTDSLTDLLLDWLGETFNSNFDDIKGHIEEFVEDWLDDRIENLLNERAAKLNLSREELSQRYGEIRKVIIGDIAAKLKFHILTLVDGHAAYAALQAASEAAPAHRDIHVQKFADRFSNIWRRFAAADKAVTDLSVFNALRNSETLSVERVVFEKFRTLHEPLVNGLVRTYGAFDGMARTIIAAHEKGRMTEAQARNISAKFGEIFDGSASAVSSIQKALTKGKSFKSRALALIFNFRTAALGAGAAALVALGFVVQLVPDNWLLGIPSDVWSAILWSILGVALVVGLFLRGGIARVVAIIAVVAGAAYIFNSIDPCKYGLSRKCVTPDTIDYVAEFDEVFDNDCEKNAAPGQAGQCIKIFYATTREFKPMGEKQFFFGNDMSPAYEVGATTILTPYVFQTTEKGNTDKACIVDAASLSERDEKAIQQQCLIKGKNAKEMRLIDAILSDPRKWPDEFDKIIESDYSDPYAYMRAASEFAKVKALNRVVVRERVNGKVTRSLSGIEAQPHLAIRDSAFFNSVQEALDVQESIFAGTDPLGKKSAMIYVHGFLTSYEDSLKTAAYLAADLNSFANPDLEETRDLSLGIPIVFSWPTLSLTDGVVDKGALKAVINTMLSAAATSKANPQIGTATALVGLTKDAGDALTVMGMNYFESQLRADQDAEAFESLVKSLANSTDIEQINIVAHSMGNRIIKSKLKLLAEVGLTNKKGKPIEIKIAQAAADIGRDDFESSLPEDDAIRNFQSTVYASGDDFALFLSSHFQGMKKEIIGNGQVPENGHQQLERIRGLLQNRSNADQSDWFSEDSCRLGRLGRSSADCEISGLARNYVDVVDASDIRKELFNDPLEFALAHGYFEYSPLVLSDMSCFFRFEGKKVVRSLKSESDTKGRPYWALVTKGQADQPSVIDECASTGRLVIGVKGVPIQSTRFKVYFDVQKTEPCEVPFGDDTVDSGAPEVCGREGDSYIKAQVSDSLAKIAGRPEMIMEIKITGHTDCSNKSGKFDNRGLASDRADKTKKAVVKAISNAGGRSDQYNFTEVKGEKCPNESARRDKNERFAEVEITFKRKPK